MISRIAINAHRPELGLRAFVRAALVLASVDCGEQLSAPSPFNPTCHGCGHRANDPLHPGEEGA